MIFELPIHCRGNTACHRDLRKMSLLARRQEAAAKTSYDPSTASPARVTKRTRARLQDAKKTQPTKQLAHTTSDHALAPSNVTRTSNGIVISLRGEELRWLISRMQGCHGPDPTVHIALHEHPPEDSETPCASAEPSFSSRSPHGQPSVLHSVLDTLRTTSGERTLLESISSRNSQADIGSLSSEGYPNTDNSTPEAYMISADLSDAELEWDQFTTF